jgi:hypothetical protein
MNQCYNKNPLPTNPISQTSLNKYVLGYNTTYLSHSSSRQLKIKQNLTPFLYYCGTNNDAWYGDVVFFAYILNHHTHKLI